MNEQLALLPGYLAAHVRLVVVALGWGDMETVLALGGQVVGTSDWLGFGGDGVGPWAADLVTRTPEQLGTLELSYEAVAALAEHGFEVTVERVMAPKGRAPRAPR